MTNATQDASVTPAPAPEPTLAEQISAKQAQIAQLEKDLASATSNMAKVAATGDMKAIIEASLTITKIEAPAGADGAMVGLLPTARSVLRGLMTKQEQATFDAKWESVSAPLNAEIERIKSLFTPEIKALCAEFKYQRIAFDVDGFGSETAGVNVNLRRIREGGASPVKGSRVSSGTRAPRNAKWSNGTTVYDSALDVVKANGLSWANSGNLKGDPDNGFPATAEGWVAQRVAYKKDASNLARQHGYAPVTS